LPSKARSFHMTSLQVRGGVGHCIARDFFALLFSVRIAAVFFHLKPLNFGQPPAIVFWPMIRFFFKFIGSKSGWLWYGSNYLHLTRLIPGLARLSCICMNSALLSGATNWIVFSCSCSCYFFFFFYYYLKHVILFY
jgi:hypothetical protein